ncbi:MAG: XTP/dITP diphosphatase [Candidatus Bathyarchaeia archaeon]|jgi:XTP/dITP diphosphohydrolase
MLKNASSDTGKVQFNGKTVIFVTGNFHKFNEVRSILNPIGIAVGMLRIKGNEIQSDDIKEIAKNSAIEAFNRCHLPLIVEDAGLFIEALENFPGPYAAYVYKTIHNKGILKLMENIQNRKAIFRSAIVYISKETGPLLFEGEVKGEITLTERKGKGNSGFGFDPIFQPSDRGKTFAEMCLEEKNQTSHRAMAVSKFAKWYLKA